MRDVLEVFYHNDGSIEFDVQVRKESYELRLSNQ